uniref:Uncharacterized protein n=1 Tax=Panagrolaimus sp. PS1159 TaxID=55785 RepID=A0AC35GFV1_9BILA
MVGDIVDITKETITEKAHESKMQRPEDKGITGLAAELAKDVGDMVNSAVEGTKAIVADAVEGTKEIVAARNYSMIFEAFLHKYISLKNQNNFEDVISDAFESTKEIAADKGLIDFANKLASDVKATVGNVAETTKEKVLQATDSITDHLSNTHQVGKQSDAV